MDLCNCFLPPLLLFSKDVLEGRVLWHRLQQRPLSFGLEMYRVAQRKPDYIKDKPNCDYSGFFVPPYTFPVICRLSLIAVPGLNTLYKCAQFAEHLFSDALVCFIAYLASNIFAVRKLASSLAPPIQLFSRCFVWLRFSRLFWKSYGWTFEWILKFKWNFIKTIVVIFIWNPGMKPRLFSCIG